MDKRTASALGSLAAGLVLALVWWAVGSGGGDGGASTDPSDRPSDRPSASAATATPSDGTVAEADLPVQARDTLDLIDRGGPFPYPDHDGGTFGNYEGLLPDEPRGYYREYTVEDPAESDRGPWRIITGSSGEYYWTPDHYAHFYRIARS